MSKKYELLLQGDKKLIVSKEEADYILGGLNSRQEFFKIGLNVFKRSAFKGLFPISEEVAENKEAWLRENKEWDETCRKMAARSVDDKVTTELTNRILPGLELSGIKLKDYQIKVIELNIRTFFESHPKYPRCPMRIWWDFIGEQIAPKEKDKRRANPTIKFAKWWEYVSRNDNAIAEWIKYN